MGLIRVSAFSIKIDTVEVKDYVRSYDMTMGADQPFPLLHLFLNPANVVDGLVTIAEGSSVVVSASNAGTFTVVSIVLQNNEYEIVAVHSTYRVKSMLSSAYTDTPATIFSTIAQALGYASGDVVVDATAYGSIKIPAGENLWDVLQYLGYLADARVWFTTTKAYMTDWSDPTASSVIIGGVSNNTDVLGNPTIDRSVDEVINSVKVTYELGEATATDATSISAYGTSYATSRNYSTEATTSATAPAQDAQATADGIIALYKDASLGIGYQISERVMDTTYKAWQNKYDEYGKADITDTINGVSATGLPMTMWTHHYPMCIATYWFGKGDTNQLTTELSKLANKVTSKVSAGDVTADLSNRPISLQVYGDQTLDTFDETSLTGFYLGKLKDGSGNDVYIWAGVDSGTEQVRMDTDGKIKAGAGAVLLDADGLSIKIKNSTGIVRKNQLDFIDEDDEIRGNLSSTRTSTNQISSTRLYHYHEPGAAPNYGYASIASLYDEVVRAEIQVQGTSGYGRINMTAISGALGLPSNTSDPSTGTVNGDIYYDSQVHRFRMRRNGTWKTAVDTDGTRIDASGCTNGIRLPTISNTANLPSSAQEGDMIAYNGSPPRIYIYLNGSWRYEDV